MVGDHVVCAKADGKAGSSRGQILGFVPASKTPTDSPPSAAAAWEVELQQLVKPQGADRKELTVTQYRFKSAVTHLKGRFVLLEKSDFHSCNFRDDPDVFFEQR